MKRQMEKELDSFEKMLVHTNEPDNMTMIKVMGLQRIKKEKQQKHLHNKPKSDQQAREQVEKE